MQKIQVARVGDYVIERQIGVGGMGVVYLAKQITLHRAVALKVLRENLLADKNYIDRFFHEVRLLSGMEHPNLVRVYEGGEDGSGVYFSMEYVEGDDLKCAIDRRRNFSERDAADIAVQVAAALEYAWNKEKMIHRDIKPANIILRQDGTVKILDFGISKKVQVSGNGLITNTGMMVGSPSYMSPEQARAERDVDFRTDIYSLGITLFHLLTGQVPYDGKSAVEVVTQHLSAPVPNIRTCRPGISRKMAKMIRRMMAKNKNDRYNSWDELSRDMLKIRDKADRTKTVSRKWLYWAGGITAAALGIIVYLSIILLNTKQNTAAVPGNPPAPMPEKIQPAAEVSLDMQIADGIREYRKISGDYQTLLQKKNDEFLQTEQYRDAVEYFQTQPDLPKQFQPDGKLRQTFLSDSVLQEWITVHLEIFEKQLAVRSQILRPGGN